MVMFLWLCINKQRTSLNSFASKDILKLDDDILLLLVIEMEARTYISGKFEFVFNLLWEF